MARWLFGKYAYNISTWMDKCELLYTNDTWLFRIFTVNYTEINQRIISTNREKFVISILNIPYDLKI